MTAPSVRFADDPGEFVAVDDVETEAATSNMFFQVAVANLAAKKTLTVAVGAEDVC